MDMTSENLMKTKSQKTQSENIESGIILAEVVKTTLGPKGMDKLLVDPQGKITVTNDGVTILEKMQIEHPVAKMIAGVARTQEEEVGDGTTSSIMLVGKFLQNAKKLLDKGIHPTTIIKGFNLANTKAQEILEEISIKNISEDVLKKVGMTAMTGKGAEEQREMLSSFIVEAISRTMKEEIFSNYEDYIKIEMLTGEPISKSKLINGVVLANKIASDSMPKKIKDAKVLVLNTDLEIKNPEMDVTANVTSPEQLEAFRQSDKVKMNDMVLKIKNSGANVVLCQKGIDDYVKSGLSKENILAVQRITAYDIKQLSLAVGTKICSDLDNLEVGFAGLVREEITRQGSLIYVEDCKNSNSVTILLCATTDQINSEIRRALTDGIGDIISCLKDGKVLPGGGAVEIELNKRLNDFAKTLKGREQLAVEEFAESLLYIPETLAQNAGLDSINIIAELKQKNENGLFGLNLFTDEITDTFKEGIIEPLKVKTQALNSATEMATTVLRLDDTLIAKPLEN